MEAAMQLSDVPGIIIEDLQGLGLQLALVIIPRGESLESFFDFFDLEAVAFSRDGTRFATGGEDKDFFKRAAATWCRQASRTSSS